MRIEHRYSVVGKQELSIGLMVKIRAVLLALKVCDQNDLVGHRVPQVERLHRIQHRVEMQFRHIAFPLFSASLGCRLPTATRALKLGGVINLMSDIRRADRATCGA